MKQLSLMLKPSSSLCNMRCKYCFYSDVSHLREQASYGIMESKTRRTVLEHTFSQLTDGDFITIAFQGGEPTLAGLDWFEQMVEEVSLLSPPKVKLSYALQTNGLVKDQAWFPFLKKHNFLVGLSLDGPRELHDRNRIDPLNKGTFSHIITTKERLEYHHIPYNILMVLTNSAARHPGKIWNFLKAQNIDYVQFIPCLAPFHCEKDPFALTPSRYADFYTQLFDLWFEDTRQGRYRSIKLFDDLVNLIAHGEESACGIAGTCHGQLIVESNGNVYPCDFYATDEWCLGNLQESTIREVYEAPRMIEFRSRPREVLPACANCPYHTLCGGGCPRMQKEVFCSPNDKFCGHRAFLDSAIARLQSLSSYV